jgi:hypothetical protein
MLKTKKTKHAIPTALSIKLLAEILNSFNENNGRK